MISIKQLKISQYEKVMRKSDWIAKPQNQPPQGMLGPRHGKTVRLGWVNWVAGQTRPF